MSFPADESSLRAYLAQSESYIDARRFAQVREGREGLEHEDGIGLTRLGAWVTRWKHWSRQPLRWSLSPPSDMERARTESEVSYHQQMVEFVNQIEAGRLSFFLPTEVNTPVLFQCIDMAYWYEEWIGWSRDMSDECPLRNHPRREESIFTDWHNKKVFQVAISRCHEVCQLVSHLWYKGVELLPVYPVPSSLLYMYFTNLKIPSRGVAGRSYDAVAISEFAHAAIPTVVGLASWGCLCKHFKDERLWDTGDTT